MAGLSFQEVLAAGMGMGPPAPCGGPFPPCPVPVDNGVWALLGTAILFTVYKIYKSRKALGM